VSRVAARTVAVRTVAVRRANRVIGCVLVVLCVALCVRAPSGGPGEYRKRRKGMKVIGGRAFYDRNLPQKLGNSVSSIHSIICDRHDTAAEKVAAFGSV
jgi:hypothetical protein